MQKKKKSSFKLNPPFAGIEFEMMESEAFKDLPLHAKWLYIEFKHRFNGENQNHIIFPYQEAEQIMSLHTFKKDRKLLLKRGCIDIIKRGGLEKQNTIYGLSNRWRKYGTKDFIKADLRKIFPKIFKKVFKKKHKFLGNQYKKEEHL